MVSKRRGRARKQGDAKQRQRASAAAARLGAAISRPIRKQRPPSPSLDSALWLRNAIQSGLLEGLPEKRERELCPGHSQGARKREREHGLHRSGGGSRRTSTIRRRRSRRVPLSCLSLRDPRAALRRESRSRCEESSSKGRTIGIRKERRS